MTTTYKEFIAFKMNIVKEVKKVIEENDLLTADLEKVFKTKLLLVEDNVPTKKEKKTRNGPTEHNLRVKAGMEFLKEQYPHVLHKIRLGTANYASTFLKNNPSASMEECIAYGIKRTHEVGKFGDIYDQPPPPPVENADEETSTTKKKKTQKSKDEADTAESTTDAKVKNTKNKIKTETDTKEPTEEPNEDFSEISTCSPPKSNSDSDSDSESTSCSDSEN